MGLCLLQQEIGDFDQQAALTTHQPDLLQLSPRLALPVGQIPHFLQRLPLGVPQAHLVQAHFELNEGVASRRGLQTGREAALRVLWACTATSRTCQDTRITRWLWRITREGGCGSKRTTGTPQPGWRTRRVDASCGGGGLTCTTSPSASTRPPITRSNRTRAACGLSLLMSRKPMLGRRSSTGRCSGKQVFRCRRSEPASVRFRRTGTSFGLCGVYGAKSEFRPC